MNNPIHAGKSQYPIQGSLLSAAQHVEHAGRLLLTDTDADDATLRKVLQTFEALNTIRARIDGTRPETTAAQRHQQ